MIEIPLHCFSHTTLESLLWPPVKFTLDFARIDGITAIMPGPVSDELDLFFIGLRSRLQFIEQATQGMHHVEVRLLIPTSDVIGFTELTGFQHAA